MYTLKIDGNFFLIIDSNSLEHSRHPSSDTSFQVYKEETENPDIVFFGIKGIFNTKSSERASFKFNELIDNTTGVSFTSFTNLKNFLSDNLGVKKPSSRKETKIINDTDHSVIDKDSGSVYFFEGLGDATVYYGSLTDGHEFTFINTTDLIRTITFSGFDGVYVRDSSVVKKESDFIFTLSDNAHMHGIINVKGSQKYVNILSSMSDFSTLKVSEGEQAENNILVMDQYGYFSCIPLSVLIERIG